MSAVLSPATIPGSLLPANTFRMVRSSAVAQELARVIEAADEKNRSVDEVIDGFLDAHLTPFAGYDFKSLRRQIVNHMAEGFSNTLILRASVAADIILTQRIGHEVPVKGWIRGEFVVVGSTVFQLSGEACTACKVNPSAHTLGGGVHCVNVNKCGHSERVEDNFGPVAR